MKKLTKLLNKYYLERSLYEESIRNYNSAKYSLKKFLPIGCQTRKDIEKFKQEQQLSSNLSFEELKRVYNEKAIPLTRMRTTDIRRIEADSTKQLKELVKMHQHFKDKAYTNLVKFIEEGEEEINEKTCK